MARHKPRGNTSKAPFATFLGGKHFVNGEEVKGREAINANPVPRAPDAPKPTPTPKANIIGMRG